MANTANTVNATMPGIKNNWSLLAFARAHGAMKVGTFTNKDQNSPDYGKQFRSCFFVDPNDSRNITFVAFSRNLGELSPQQIAAQKNDLQVVELENGHYSLCKQGSLAGDDVDLGL